MGAGHKYYRVTRSNANEYSITLILPTDGAFLAATIIFPSTFLIGFTQASGLNLATDVPCWPVSPAIYWTGCSQPGAPNASPRFSATFTGCGSRNGFNSVSAFWHSDVSMDQRRHISLRASSNSRCGRSSLPPIIHHHDACCPVSAAINSW